MSEGKLVWGGARKVSLAKVPMQTRAMGLIAAVACRTGVSSFTCLQCIFGAYQSSIRSHSMRVCRSAWRLVPRQAMSTFTKTLDTETVHIRGLSGPSHAILMVDKRQGALKAVTPSDQVMAARMSALSVSSSLLLPLNHSSVLR